MYDVITIGTATRDAFILSDAFRTLADEQFSTGKGLCVPFGSKIDVEDIVFTTGGGGTNTAVTFARQGYTTACFCRVGNDVSGREVLSELEEEGVNTDLVVQDPAHKTAYSILLLSEGGERTVLVYRGASRAFGEHDGSRVSTDTRWFHLTGSLPIAVVEQVIERAHEAGAQVAFNPSAVHFKAGLAALKTILEKVDVFSLNREEAARLTGKDYKNADGIFAILDRAVRGLVVMTEGPQGVRVSDGTRRYRAGIFKEQTLKDRTGAGDAFSSGLVAGLMRGSKKEGFAPEVVKKAIRLASANATSVVEHIGTKEGILTQQSFKQNKRWESFPIEVEEIN